MPTSEQRLLVSVRGPVEAVAAAKGGANIADIEYPGSALGTPYPLNIKAVRERLRKARLSHMQISTNIGEIPNQRPNACQSALGVATAGADLIKFGLAELPLEAAVYVGREIVRTVKEWHPQKKVYPAVFVDMDMQRYFKVFDESPELMKKIGADGVLIDTFDKSVGKGLLDYCEVKEIKAWVGRVHRAKREAWIAGSIVKEELPDLWGTGVDVICVRGAACKAGKSSGRFGEVDQAIVKELVGTMPGRHPRTGRK